MLKAVCFGCSFRWLWWRWWLLLFAWILMDNNNNRTDTWTVCDDRVSLFCFVVLCCLRQYVHMFICGSSLLMKFNISTILFCLLSVLLVRSGKIYSKWVWYIIMMPQETNFQLVDVKKNQRWKISEILSYRRKWAHYMRVCAAVTKYRFGFNYFFNAIFRGLGF